MTHGHCHPYNKAHLAGVLATLCVARTDHGISKLAIVPVRAAAHGPVNERHSHLVQLSRVSCPCMGINHNVHVIVTDPGLPFKGRSTHFMHYRGSMQWEHHLLSLAEGQSG